MSDDISNRKAMVNRIDSEGNVVETKESGLDVPYDIIHRQYSEYILATVHWWMSRPNTVAPQWDTIYVEPYNHPFATGELIFLVKEGNNWQDYVIRTGDGKYWVLNGPDSGQVSGEVILRQ
jgi:hypothetical protein